MAAVDPKPALISRAPLEVIYGESPKERTKPPHHLLETQIFPNLHKNEIFQVEPEQLSFIIQQNSKPKKLRVINTSATRQNFHVIEPLNHKNWSISYKKPDGGLVSGGNVEISVKFHTPQNPEPNSIYQDSIRLHCTGGNLLIPLYAYPTIDNHDFPSKINFGSVPLGQETVRTINISAPRNESFDYSCTMHPPSDAFDVQPSCGTIKGESQITVSYRPTEFITSSTNLQILFSTFDRKVLKCKINGNCLPGLLTLKKKKEFALKRKEKIVKPPTTKETSDLLARLAREQSSKLRKKSQNKKPKSATPPPRIFPGAQHHVNKILNSTEPESIKSDSHDQLYLERSKIFREKLRQNLEAEKINKLRWQIRIGDEIPTFDELEAVRQSRKVENNRIGNRTEREANSIPSFTPNFDPYRNSPWRARHVALGQFQQAARTILIRIRAEDRLFKLRKLMKLVNGDGLSIEDAEATLLAQMGRQIQRKINGPSGQTTPFVHDSSSSSNVFKEHEAIGKMNGDEVNEDSIPVRIDGKQNDPYYYPLVNGEYSQQQGLTGITPTYGESRLIGGFDMGQLTEEGFTDGNFTDEDVINQIKHLKIRSGEKKQNQMTYNEIMSYLRPNQRHTQSAPSINDHLPNPSILATLDAIDQDSDED